MDKGQLRAGAFADCHASAIVETKLPWFGTAAITEFLGVFLD